MTELDKLERAVRIYAWVVAAYGVVVVVLFVVTLVSVWRALT